MSIPEKFTTNAIKRAGKNLIKNHNDEKSLDILSYWRSDHIKPLDEATKLLKEISDSIDKHAIIAKRLKRTASIIRKLERFKDKGMQLSTMNDIGGCRIVLSNTKKVYKLVKFLTLSNKFQLRNDYIENPKPDGYKSIHLIGEFNNSNGEKRKIELQIRTRVQHSWATALEIVDLFTQQSIKTNMGNKDWSDFFLYLSKQFTLLERNNYLLSSKIESNYIKFIEDFKKSENEELRFSIYKVHTLIDKLNIINNFNLFKESLNITSSHLSQYKTQEGYILIKIDKLTSGKEETFNVSSVFYPKKDLDEALEEYLRIEKNTLSGKAYVVALVSVDSISDIQNAYPNYFADSTKFIEYVLILKATYEKLYPSIFGLSNKFKYMFRK